MNSNRFASSYDHLRLYLYPIREENSSELQVTEEGVEYLGNLGRKLFNLQILEGASEECVRIQRMKDCFLTLEAIKKACHFYRTHRSPHFIENCHMLLAFRVLSNEYSLQSILHTAFNKIRDEIEIVHVASSPCNLPLSKPLKISRVPCRGAGTFVTERAISLMHSLYPNRPVYVETRHTGVPFFQKKFDFEIVGKKADFTVMFLSKKKTSFIANKVLRSLK